MIKKFAFFVMIYITAKKSPRQFKRLFEHLSYDLDQKVQQTLQGALSTLGTMAWNWVTWKLIFILFGLSGLSSLVNYTFKHLFLLEANHNDASPAANLPRFSMFRLSNTLARRGKPIRLSSPGYTAYQLDKKARTQGIHAAEEYFRFLPEAEKCHVCYLVLFSWFCKELEVNKSQCLFSRMKNNGMSLTTMGYNRLLNLNLKKRTPKCIPGLIADMKRSDIKLNVFSYNVWIKGLAAMGDILGVQAIIREIKKNHGKHSIDWTTHTTLARVYIDAGCIEKAKTLLFQLERISGKGNLEMKKFLIQMYERIKDNDSVIRLRKQMAKARR